MLVPCLVFLYSSYMSEKRRILIVDDEPDHLAALQLFIGREEDFEIVTAGNTSEAGEIMKRGVDLVLLDIALPGESGTDFCLRIKENEACRDIPIIAISAYPGTIWKDRAIEAGCVEYISKPSEPKTIIELIRKHLPS